MPHLCCLNLLQCGADGIEPLRQCVDAELDQSVALQRGG